LDLGATDIRGWYDVNRRELLRDHFAYAYTVYANDEDASFYLGVSVCKHFDHHFIPNPNGDYRSANAG
jgi:hypothetical protein